MTAQPTDPPPTRDPARLVVVAEALLGRGLIGSGDPGHSALRLAERVLAALDAWDEANP
jgi:hypothetical protein